MAFHEAVFSLIRVNLEDCSVLTIICSDTISQPGLVSCLPLHNIRDGIKKHVLREVFTSMDDIIQLAKSDERKSLATLKPREIVDFVIEEDERNWKQKWKDQLLQYNLFDLDERGQGKVRKAKKVNDRRLGGGSAVLELSPSVRRR